MENYFEKEYSEISSLIKEAKTILNSYSNITNPHISDKCKNEIRNKLVLFKDSICNFLKQNH